MIMLSQPFITPSALIAPAKPVTVELYSAARYIEVDSVGVWIGARVENPHGFLRTLEKALSWSRTDYPNFLRRVDSITTSCDRGVWQGALGEEEWSRVLGSDSRISAADATRMFPCWILLIQQNKDLLGVLVLTFRPNERNWEILHGEGKLKDLSATAGVTQEIIEETAMRLLLRVYRPS